MKQAVVLFFLHFSSGVTCDKPNILADISSKNKIKSAVTRIFFQFKDYDLVYHFDNAHYQIIDFIDLPKVDPHFSIYYYDTDLSEDKVRFPGLRQIHIVALHNAFHFEVYSRLEYNFQSQDLVVFFVNDDLKRNTSSDSKTVEVWQMKGIDTAAGIFVVDINDWDTVYTACHYCGTNRTGVLTRINDPSKLSLYINKYRNFDGHVFKIAYTDFPPLFWCETRTGEYCTKSRGPESVMLNEMSRMYNFRFKLVKYKSELNDRGEWQAIIEGVHFRRVDWAVGGISVSIERGISTDFTRFIKTQGFSIMYATYDPMWMFLKSFLLAFQWRIWLMILAAIFLVTALSSISVLPVNSTLNQVSRVSFTFFKIAAYPIVEQHSEMGPFKMTFKLKMFLVFWWLMCLCLTTIYRSRLASVLIRPGVNEPKTIEDLVTRGYKFQVNQLDWSVLRENLIFSSDKIFGEVLSKVNDELSFCQSVDKVLLSTNIAVIDEEIPIQFDTLATCNIKSNRLRLVTENIFPSSYHAWCMQMATPFRLTFSRTIGRMNDFGLIDHWYKDNYYISRKIPRSNVIKGSDRETIALKVTQVLAPLVLLAVGLLLSFLVFLMEILINKTRSDEC